MGEAALLDTNLQLNGNSYSTDGTYGIMTVAEPTDASIESLPIC